MDRGNGGSMSDLALFDGDELLKHKFMKRCVFNSKSSDSSQMEDGWGDDGGDDSLLYQAADVVTKEVDNDSDMFSDSDKKVIPDTPSDEEKVEGSDESTEVGLETDALKDLLKDLGLNYSNVVVKNCTNTKGMVICDMTCKVDIKTELKCRLARESRKIAVAAAHRDISNQVRTKYFPDLQKCNDELSGHKQKLISFCKTSKRPDPLFNCWLEHGLYCVSVLVGEDMAKSSGSYQVLAEAEGSAAKLWLDMFGGVMDKKVAVSEAFSVDDEFVDETVSKENWPNQESFSSKEEVLEQVIADSNRRPKKGGFFSSLDNMSDSELSIAKAGSAGNSAPTVKTAFSLLDKKNNSNQAIRWSPRKQISAVPRRSPRKQARIVNMFQSQKKELLKGRHGGYGGATTPPAGAPKRPTSTDNLD